jgi:hypothetical protein
MCGLTTTVTTTATTDGSRRHPSGTFRDGPIHATSVIAQPEKRKVGRSILPLTTIAEDALIVARSQ